MNTLRFSYSNTAFFWVFDADRSVSKYDTRLGRRWNVDPVVKEYESPYCVLGNNPISVTDWNGDDSVSVIHEKNDQDKPTNNSEKAQISKQSQTPSIAFKYGNTGAPFSPINGSGATTIWGIYGNKEYYNTQISGSRFAPDEPNNFFQLQIQIRGKESNTQLSFAGFKQKFYNQNGFGYEAPSAFHIGLSKNFGIKQFSNSINLSNNVTFGIGPEFGKPRFDDPSITIPNRLNVSKYRPIDVGASLISRVDATFINRVTLFAAGTIHHMQTFSQKSSIGVQKSRTIGSVALTCGVGVNVGTRR